MGVSRQFHAFVAAVQFLTVLPLPGGMNRPDPGRRTLRAAVVYFPLVGGLIGAATGGLTWAASHVWPPLVAALLALAVEAVLTGGLHEDAVADCCDAFGGGWTREDVLRILKDSRIGSFGALGLLLAVSVRASGLAAVEPGLVVAASAAAGAVGRWAILIIMAAAPPVPDREGLAKEVGDHLGRRALVAGTLAAVPAVVWYGAAEPARLAAGAAAAAGVAAAWAVYLRRRLGGATGDCLGAGCYAGQLAVLLAAAGGAR